MFRFSRWEIRAWSEEQPDICVDLNSWQCSDANPSASAKDPLLGMEETYQRSKTINLDFNANSKEKMRRERMRGRVTDWDNSTASDHIMHCSTDQHKLYIYIYWNTQDNPKNTDCPDQQWTKRDSFELFWHASFYRALLNAVSFQISVGFFMSRKLIFLCGTVHISIKFRQKLDVQCSLVPLSFVRKLLTAAGHGSELPVEKKNRDNDF